MAILTPGLMIRETYEVERLLGEGAFAEVYRVKHRFLGRQALKIFKVPGMTFEEIEQVMGEAALLSQLGHPNIIRVYDANVFETPKGNYGFFTMEYVAGGSLDKFWQSFGRSLIPIETTVDLIRQLCRGIAVGHSENPPIIHRDIKPQNILVGYDGDGLRVRVSDFGLAKRVNPLTFYASARGTINFKAPEVFSNPLQDSCAGDVWAIGTTLYLLLTDQLPFPEIGDESVFNRQSFERPIEPPSNVNFEVDDELEKICLRALSINPKYRHKDANELLKEMENWKPAQLIKPRTNIRETSKESLGDYSPFHEEDGHKLCAKALELAKKPSQLSQAADLMEESFQKYPPLREKYQDLIKLWRRGISY